MEGIELKVKRLHPDAVIPTYGTDGAACFDLYVATAPKLSETAPGTYHMHTGLAVEVPEGFALMVYSRSGHGFKWGVRLANCVGVIDSDYRGEIIVALTSDTGLMPVTLPGDRIAQAMLVPVPRVAFHEVDELSDTARGAGGFGSTGN